MESYTTGVTGRQVYDLLSAATINENDVVVTWTALRSRNKDDFKKDDLGRNNKDDLKYTGNGALTEVYLDDDNDRVTIATINTYLAQATSDYSEGARSTPPGCLHGPDKLMPSPASTMWMWTTWPESPTWWTRRSTW